MTTETKRPLDHYTQDYFTEHYSHLLNDSGYTACFLASFGREQSLTLSPISESVRRKSRSTMAVAQEL